MSGGEGQDRDALGVAGRVDDLVMSVAEILEVECVGLLLRDAGGRLRAVSSSGPAAMDLELAQEAAQVGPGPDVHRTGVPLAVPDVLAVPDYAALAVQVRGSGVRAVLSVPVVCGEQVLGNLNAVDPHPHPWSDRQQTVLVTFAALMADLLVMSAVSTGVGPGQLATRLADLDGPAS